MSTYLVRPLRVAMGVGALLIVSACSSGSGIPVSAKGRVPGDHGKLLPKLSCWIQAADNSGSGTVVISVAVPAGQKVNCPKLAGVVRAGVHMDYQEATAKASVTSPVPMGQLSGNEVCQGSLTYSSGSSSFYSATVFDFGSGGFGPSVLETNVQNIVC